MAELAALMERKRRECGIPGPKPGTLAPAFQAMLDRLPPPPPEPTPEEIAERERRREAAKQVALREQRQRWNAALTSCVGARYADCRLKTFEVSNDAQRAVVASLTEFNNSLADHVAGGEGLVLFGPKGTGKDHLLVAMLRNAIDADLAVRWVNGSDLFGSLRDRMDGDNTEESFIRDLAEPSVLAISDPLPPVGSLTEWQSMMLFRILDRRYRAMRPTWATLNVSSGKEANERMAGQLVDRLKDGALCLGCNWESYRKELKL